jgi:hypothetical protein
MCTDEPVRDKSGACLEPLALATIIDLASGFGVLLSPQLEKH